MKDCIGLVYNDNYEMVLNSAIYQTGYKGPLINVMGGEESTETPPDVRRAIRGDENDVIPIDDPDAL